MLARQGESVTLEPRFVSIYEIEIVEYSFPHLELRVRCGSGTYIRSIGRDVGESLGCGAVMTALQRTHIGPFTLSHAVDVNERISAESLPPYLQPLPRGVTNLTSYTVSPDELVWIRVGRKIVIADAQSPEVAAFDDRGQLIAVLTHDGDHWYRPHINLSVTVG
jgi:tRNA pseudouridine55 synthase